VKSMSEGEAADRADPAAITTIPVTSKLDLYDHELAACAWRKSQFSAGEGQCVEIRDSRWSRSA